MSYKSPLKYLNQENNKEIMEKLCPRKDAKILKFRNNNPIYEKNLWAQKSAKIY